MPPHAHREIRLRAPLDLRLTLAPARRGHQDPTMRLDHHTCWRATRTCDGPATTCLSLSGDRLDVEAWGPGAARAVEQAPALVGTADDATGFVPHHPLLRELVRRRAGLRIGATGAVADALFPTVLEQKVTGLEARRSYRRLVVALGQPAPGPGGAAGLVVPPAPSTLAATPSWTFHRAGVERKRADTVRRAMSRAVRLEEIVELPLPEAYRRLQAFPGIGPWSAAEVGLVALGDADAVSVGDYHLPNQVAWALAGEPRADDARMLEILEPYRGHRARVIRLIVSAGLRAPRYGPRLAPRSFAAM